MKPQLVGLKTYRGTGTCRGRAVAVAPDGGVYVAGEFTRSFAGLEGTSGTRAFLARLDPQGDMVWIRAIGVGGTESVYQVAVSTEGRLLAAGTTIGSVDAFPNSSGRDAWLACYDTDGNRLWVQTLPGSSREFGLALSAAPAGGALLAGIAFGAETGTPYAGEGDRFYAHFDRDGNHTTTVQPGVKGLDYAQAVAWRNDGRVLVAGAAPNPTAAVRGDAVVGCHDGTGALRWEARLPSTYSDAEVQSIATDPAGYTWVAGRTLGRLAQADAEVGGIDLFVACLELDGGVRWAKQLGTRYTDHGASLALDPAGGAIVAMTTWFPASKRPTEGSTALALYRLDAGGELLWSEEVSASGNERSGGAALGPTGDLYVVGTDRYGALAGAEGLLLAVYTEKAETAADLQLLARRRFNQAFDRLAALRARRANEASPG